MLKGEPEEAMKSDWNLQIKQLCWNGFVKFSEESWVMLTFDFGDDGRNDGRKRTSD